MPQPVEVVVRKEFTWKTPFSWMWFVLKLLLAIWFLGLVGKSYHYVERHDNGDITVHSGWWGFRSWSHFGIGVAILVPLYVLFYMVGVCYNNPRWFFCGPSGKEKALKLREQGPTPVAMIPNPAAQEELLRAMLPALYQQHVAAQHV